MTCMATPKHKNPSPVPAAHEINNVGGPSLCHYNCLIQYRQEEDKKYCILLHGHALAEYINFTLLKLNLTSLGVGVLKFTIFLSPYPTDTTDLCNFPIILCL